MSTFEKAPEVLILGIGNYILGDEGIGVHIVKYIEDNYKLSPGIEALDGGTGGIYLIEAVHESKKVIIIDATMDEQEPGSVTKLYPKYSADYPRSLSAHDIGLKDMLDAWYIMDGKPVDVTLFAITIPKLCLDDPCIDLSDVLEERIKEYADMIVEDAESKLKALELQSK